MKRFDVRIVEGRESGIRELGGKERLTAQVGRLARLCAATSGTTTSAAVAVTSFLICIVFVCKGKIWYDCNDRLLSLTR